VKLSRIVDRPRNEPKKESYKQKNTKQNTIETWYQWPMGNNLMKFRDECHWLCPYVIQKNTTKQNKHAETLVMETEGIKRDRWHTSMSVPINIIVQSCNAMRNVSQPQCNSQCEGNVPAM
jgi:hypothetical protein